jgi:hypothetical protein
MMDSVDATEEQTRAQEALNKVLELTNQLYKNSIQDLQDVTKERLLRAKIAGKSESDLLKIEKEAEAERYQNYINERNRLQALLNDRNLTAENADKINNQLAENQREYFKSVNDGRIKDLEEELTVVEAKRQANKDLLAKQAEDRLKAIEQARKKREEEQKALLEEADRFFKEVQDREKERTEKANELKLEQLETLNKGITESEEDKNIRLGLLAQEEADKRRVLEESVADAKVDIAFRTADLIKEIAGEGSKVGKALSIAQATISGIEGVQNAFTTASKSPITTLFPAYPYVQAGLAGAFSILQIKKIMSTDPSGKSGGGSSSASSEGGQAPSAPSFNLLQGTGANQIAEGLATQRQPIQAYVVSGAVTSAQQLQRNIVNDASL